MGKYEIDSMENFVNIFKERSIKPLDFAREKIMKETFKSETLREAARYYLLNWKEYTHVGIASLASEAVGADPDDLTEAKSGVFALNASFDIHDDIIDCSKTKHGKLTVFGKYGKEIALLLGDLLLIKGFEWLCKPFEASSSDDEGKLLARLGKLFLELGDAHACEIALRGRWDVSAEEYLRVLEMKAAAIEADTYIGAMIGGGESYAEVLSSYGRDLGVLLALREEFIDVFESRELQNRIANRLLPLPMLYAFQDANAKKEILSVVSRKRILSKDAETVVNIVMQTGPVTVLKSQMKERINKATAFLNALHDPKVQRLRQLVRVVEEDL